jgi:hypothetical protein
MTFVPSYYLYPSRGAAFSRLSNFLGGIWVAVLVWVLWTLPSGDSEAVESAARGDRGLALVSLFYPVYYMAISWWITLARWRRMSGRRSG